MNRFLLVWVYFLLFFCKGLSQIQVLDSFKIDSILEDALNICRQGVDLDSALKLVELTKKRSDDLFSNYPDLAIKRLYYKGRIFEKQEKYEEGIKCLDSALCLHHIANKKTDDRIYGRCLTHYAYACFSSKINIEQAYDSLQKSIVIFKQIQKKEDVLFASCFIALYYDLKKQLEDAENTYRSLESSLNSSYNYAYLNFFYSEFSAFYWRLTIVDKAIFYLDKQQHLNDEQLCTNKTNKLLYLATAKSDTIGLKVLIKECLDCNNKYVRNNTIKYENVLNSCAEAIIKAEVDTLTLADSLLQLEANLLHLDSIDFSRPIEKQLFKNIVSYLFLKAKIALKTKDSNLLSNILQPILKVTKNFTDFKEIEPDQKALLLICGIQYYTQTKDRKLLDLLEKYRIYASDQLYRALNFMTESELNQFFQNPLFSQVDIFFETYNSEIMPPSYTGFLYELAMYSKGLIYRKSRGIRKLLNESKDSNILNLKIRWEEIELRLNGSDNLDNRLLNSEKDSMERKILKSIKDTTSKEVFQTSLVQQDLDRNDIAVEFVKYKSNNGNAHSEKYVAVVIDREHPFPQLIPLFDESELRTSSKNYFSRKEVEKEPLSTALRGYGLRPKKGNQLKEYQLIWEPILKKYPNVKTIYFSPVGELNKRNLSSISISDSLYMFDRYKMIQLTSTYNISKIKESKIAEINSALLLGGIDYGKVKSKDKEKEKYNWNFLEGTLNEVQQIKHQLQEKNISTTMLTGRSAEENMVRLHLKDPQSIIHLATHGFYDDSKEDIMQPFYNKKNPLTRSVLVLSNANANQKKDPLSNNGYLTAQEISMMDLSQTKLVVLSACETALGENISQYESNLSLKRGFKIAGAGSIISTLRSIGDKSTSLFMNRFYKHYISESMNVHEAFTETQKEISIINKNDTDWQAFILTD